MKDRKQKRQTVLSTFFSQSVDQQATKRNHKAETPDAELGDFKFDGSSRPNGPFSEKRKALFAKVNDAFKKPKLDTANENAIIEDTQLTPLEQQVIATKKKYPGIVLMFEVGYKYRFFEDDAQIAAKALRICAFMSKNLLTASVPTGRLAVHVKRLVSLGHRVGIVKQTEIAALKHVSDNKNAPFTRELSQIYTKGTFIDDLSTDAANESDIELNTQLAAVLASPMALNSSGLSSAMISVVSFDINTGLFQWDSAVDSVKELAFFLETIQTLKPSEILIAASDPILLAQCKSYCRNSNASLLQREWFCDKKQFALQFIAENAPNLLPDLQALPDGVVCCFSSIIDYLSYLNLRRFASAKIARVQSHETTCMKLPNSSLVNLQVFAREDGSTHGTLFSLLNTTHTIMGRRMLKSWVAKPLYGKEELCARREAVRELKELLATKHAPLEQACTALTMLPDLQSKLAKIELGKVSPKELHAMLSRCLQLFNVFGNLHFKAALLGSLLSDISNCEALEKEMNDTLRLFIESEAAKDNWAEMWSPAAFTKWSQLRECKAGIAKAHEALNNELKCIQKTMNDSSIAFSTCAGVEFLVELSLVQAKRAPSSWLKVSTTKTKVRFHSEATLEIYKQLQRERELLLLEMRSCFSQLVQSLKASMLKPLLRLSDCIASFDCLIALARVGLRPGFILADISQLSNVFSVTGAVHPLLSGHLMSFVANDICFSEKQRALVLSGPNMGGKSTFTRMISLLSILNQIGTFVPCTAATMCLFDGIYCRLGAADNMLKGESTFMRELLETKQILDSSTSNSLIVIDELGRGTSTFDGLAIAQATLRYLIMHKRCITLFVTHFPSLSYLADEFPESVAIGHMDYQLQYADDAAFLGRPLFLYKLKLGRTAPSSYGLNVALMAGISKDIVLKAHQISSSFAIEQDVKFCKKIKSILSL